MTKAHDLFWLAHYAYNTIQPIIEEGNKSGKFTQGQQQITVKPERQAVEVFVLHWPESTCTSLVHTWGDKGKQDIDTLAEKLRAKL
jgi:hypothetical protein